MEQSGFKIKTKLTKISMKFDEIITKLSEIETKFMQMICNHNHKQIHYTYVF